MSKSHIGRKKTESWKKAMSEIHKEKWENAEFRDRRISEIFDAFNVVPNKTEQRLDAIIQETISNEYKFCGGGDVVLGGRIPDWINCNGKKKLIELFGNYWHGKKRTGKSREKVKKERCGYFKQFGFDTLIVWENELADLAKLQSKIIDFNEDKPYDI